MSPRQPRLRDPETGETIDMETGEKSAPPLPISGDGLRYAVNMGTGQVLHFGDTSAGLTREFIAYPSPPPSSPEDGDAWFNPLTGEFFKFNADTEEWLIFDVETKEFVRRG